MTVILGFNAFHADSAACLVVDGKPLSAAAEERLGERHKRDSAFPANAIRRLLADPDLRLRDVTDVAMARDPRASYAAKMTYVALRPVKAAGAVFEHMRRNRQTKSTLEQLADVCDENRASATFKTVGVDAACPADNCG